MNRVLLGTSLAALMLSCAAAASSMAATPPDARDEQDVAKKLSNPVADMVSVPLQYNWINGNGPQHDLRFVMNLQPVVPVALNEKWNLIGRWIMPYVSQPASLGSASGIGDITASAFFSPRHSRGAIWGVGPVFGLPTTSDPGLGTGQWTIGPTVVVLKQEGPWTYGILWNQLWSFASVSDVARPDVNQGFFQPFLAHVTPQGVTFTIQSESIANWNASSDVWTIPLNVLLSKVTRFGPFPFSVAGGFGVFLESPSGGPEWQLRTAFTLVLPKK